MTNQTVTGRIFDLLLGIYGKQHWWPGDTRTEVAIGAILTQNSSWSNVEKAISNIKSAGLMDVTELYSIPDEKLAELIRPSGYFNLKARRLKNLLRLIVTRHEGSIDKLLERGLAPAREELLAVNGIGPETADAILLYAGNFPVFVVDKYTRRIFSRHQIVAPDCSYRELQNIFMSSLEPDSKLFNEYHALLVLVGKWFCKTRPNCSKCPLNNVTCYYVAKVTGVNKIVQI